MYNIYMKKKLEKLFGGIDLTWKKLIVSSIVVGLFVGLLMILPLKDTAFQDIGVIFYWWVLFGVIIIMNSKNNLDSALKCFVFFLISQPLIYLVQVPFSYMGWGLFGYYKYWFLWTILTIPMGYIGYYMKKNDFLASIILFPALALVAWEGSSAYVGIFDKPDLIFRAISTLLIIIVLAFGVLKNKIYRYIELAAMVILSIVLVVIGMNDNNVSASASFSSADLGIELNKDWKIETESTNEFNLLINEWEKFDENDQPTGEFEYSLKIHWQLAGKKKDERDVVLVNDRTEQRRTCRLYMDETIVKIIGCEDGKN